MQNGPPNFIKEGISEEIREKISEEMNEGRERRTYNRILERIASHYIVAVILFHLIYTSDLLSFLGKYTGFHWLIIPEDAFRALHLSLIIPIVFLLVPAGKKGSSDKFPWYDAILIILSLVIFGGRFLYWKDVAVDLDMGYAPLHYSLMGVVGVVIIFEVLRRSMGFAMPILTFLFFLYPIMAGYLPGFLYSRSMSIIPAINELFLGYRQGAFGEFINLAGQIVLTFVVFGMLLQVSGAGEFYTKIMLALFGRFKSGPAQAAVWGSAAVGSLCATPSANVAITGVITIPLMKSVGYTPRFAAAIEAVSASGGAIMPPVMASAAFLMADFLGITYWDVAVAAFIPALLYYFSISVTVYIEATKRGIKPLAPQEVPPLKPTLKSGWQFILPLIALIFILMILEYSPQKAALAAMITLIIVSWFRKETRVTWGKFALSLRKGARITAPLSSLFSLREF